ncbi:MAG TPA: UDP-N-acetylmuramoyl-L-alanyl-D-glutamate--2,6-diaminopimelate ligase [Jiangellales bacterium]|nr:UDP-N-acetylmuramoyl-L-alanyl-D-glutamate--2,6-diaminopimelate ligase [Jiangellales bacterium]
MPSHPPLRPDHVMPRPLTELAGTLGITASGGDAAVTGVTHDSHKVRPGDLFAALPGALTHGARFAAQAEAAGAVAFITDPDGARQITSDLPVLVVDDPRARLGELAATIYARPADDLLMLGVTGTNGKTTTTYLIESGLRAAGHRTGLVGTVETRIDSERLASVRTTPEAADLHALLAVMREQGVTACVMEVSSHALVLGRVDAIVFDVAGFTNLSQDHLDFHRDLEDYYAAKAALFTPLRSRRGVVCVDDEYGRRLAAEASVPVVTIGTRDPAGAADWVVVKREVSPSGGSTAIELDRGGRGALGISAPIPGDFNVANAALAAVMLLEAGLSAGDAARGIALCRGVPGRMESVHSTGSSEPLAVVDYAHTPEAVENVLRALRPSTRGRLIAVLGAGGNRDRHKRPLMGAAAARHADVVIVTDDNPRSEEPAAIRAAVLAGAAEAGGPVQVREVADRRQAIEAAVEAAVGTDDTVAVLGKGHEQGQEVAGVVHPFDDRLVLRQAIERWNDRRDPKAART